VTSLQADPNAERTPEAPEREHIRQHLLARRDFGSHLTVYLLTNALLIGVWGFTGHGYFWPGWVLAGWGLGLFFHARETFWRRPLTEQDIDNEILRRNST